MTKYTIHTQHVAPTLVSTLFDGFTIYKGVGYWKGKAEDSTTVVILAENSDRARIVELARRIRERYRQEEVWITVEDVSLIRVSIDDLGEVSSHAA